MSGKLGSMTSRYQRRFRLSRQWKPTTKRILKKQQKKAEARYLEGHRVACIAFLDAAGRKQLTGPKKGRSLHKCE